MGQRGAGLSRERFVEAALDLIGEAGGSQGVNLREVSRRVGCAHTNAYNYFTSLDDLTTGAFRRAVQLYADHLVAGLDDSPAPAEFLRRLVTNMASFPQQHPGLYRFITTDPIDIDRLPGDIIEMVLAVKVWLLDVFAVLCGPGVLRSDVEDLCTITTAYIDGEVINLINGRVVPGEGIAARIVGNAVRLFDWHATARGGQPAPPVERATYPQLCLPLQQARGRARADQEPSKESEK